MTENKQPTRVLADAVNVLCERSDYARGAVARDVYLGSRIVVVTLARPIVIDGECWDVEPAGEVDLLDLMDDWQQGRM